MSSSDKLHLIRDVLDKLVVDRDRIALGRVDGIVLIANEQDELRVAQIHSGTATLLRRLSQRWTRRLHWLTNRLGFRWRRPVRVPWSQIETIGKEIKLDVCAHNSRLLERERWLRDNVIRKIPGNQATKRSGS